MLLLLLFIVLSSCILLFISGRGYDNLLAEVDKKDYPLKGLLPLGLLILDLAGYNFKTIYDRSIITVLGELYGANKGRAMLRIFWANRIVYIICTVVMVLTIFQFTKKGPVMYVYLFGLIFAILYLTDRELRNRQKKRRVSLRQDFPDFINRFTLLISAGMTTKFAWEKIAAEASGQTPLQREIKRVALEMKSGTPEIKAYEQFSRRCGIPEITRLVSALVQNIRKGNSELVLVLRISADECWNMRKNLAKKMGEEASTKMIFPLIFMLVSVLLIAITPAVLALRGF